MRQSTMLIAGFQAGFVVLAIFGYLLFDRNLSAAEYESSAALVRIDHLNDEIEALSLEVATVESRVVSATANLSQIFASSTRESYLSELRRFDDE